MNEYIGSRFKWDFIARFCIGMVAISILSALFFMLVIPKGEATFYASLVFLVQRTEASLVPIILVVGLFELVLALLFTLLLSLFLSHRVGGAIFKLERNVERLKNGEISIQKMSLRGTDQGQILAVKFNEMIHNWQANFNELMFYCGKFSARTNGFKKGLFTVETCNAEAIARIKNDVGKIQAVLDRFTI
jgi:HAMP domain-containing protein